MFDAVSHRPPFAPYPLATLAASFAAGIFITHTFATPLTICLACGAACTTFAIWCFARRRHGLASFIIVIAFFCAGGALVQVERKSVGAERIRRLYDEGVIASGDPLEATGVLERAPEPSIDGFYLALRVEKIRYKEQERIAMGRLWLFAPARDLATRARYEALELRYGARIRVMTALDRTENFRNPGVSSLTEYLERRGFDATGAIKSPLLVERLDDDRVFLPLAWLYEWRQRLLAEIGKRFSVETAGVLEAALLGNRYHLSRQTAERFRDGGTFHVLVISGLHIAFIGWLALILARRITKKRVWQFTFSVALVWAYSLAVGAEASVVRAALMFTVAALAPVLSRRAHTLNALGGAALALLVWRPEDLFDPSFQLTFLSVLAIIALAWPLLQKAKEVGAWRPTRALPYPPACAGWWQKFSETLFWSEREWRREMARSTYDYRLFKTPVAAKLERWRVQRLLRYTMSAVLVSTCVQVGLLPLLVLYFHRFSMASFVLNIGVGVLMAALALVALGALLLAQVSASAAAPLFAVAEGVNWLMIHSVDPFIRWRFASIRLPEYTGPAAIIYVLYYAPLIVLAVAVARWNPLRRAPSEIKNKNAVLRYVPQAAALALCLLLVITIAHPMSAGIPDGRLRIDFLDVGQGDAALLTMPDGTTLLVDGGGRPRFGVNKRSFEDEGAEPFERDAREIGEAIVSEYLWWRGLDHVDYILATHADADHIEGLNDVARNFKVRAALVARAPGGDPEYARFAATMQQQCVPVYSISRGDSFHFGAVAVDVLWPLRAASDAPSANNDSVVLRLRFGEKVFMLTGDVEKETEAVLVDARDDLGADVVKVAHHGSKTSSTQTFVAATHPKLAIISVGLDSQFGHPHKSVLENWRSGGAQILTTGKSGTITVSTNGRDLQVETFVRP